MLTDASAVPVKRDVFIDGGVISALREPGGELWSGSQRIEGNRTLIIPGLINAHYHSHDVLARGLFEDIPLEVWIALAILPPWRKVTKEEVRLRTLIGAAENLRNGTTTVQDMLGCGPGSEDIVEAALAAYAEIGIRCVMSLQVGNRPAIDCLPGIRESMPLEIQPLISGNPPDVEQFLSFVATPLQNAAKSRLHWAIAPGSPQRCTIELMAGLGDLARARRLPYVTHVNESKLQVFLARELYGAYGGSVLDYLEAAGVLNSRLCMAHGIWFSDAEIDRIGSVGAAVATCPASNLKLKNGVAPHGALLRAGAQLTLGCDNVSAGDGQNMFEAMRSLAHLNSGRGPQNSPLDARAVLAIATQGAANVLGIGDLVGSIAVGKRADLTIIDLDDFAYLPLNNAQRQLVYAENGRGVRDVLVDGEFVVRDRKLVKVDQAKLIEGAGALLEIVQRDYADHFARMAPAIPYIAGTARRESDRSLPFSRWIA
ncbi:amidohydrolase family protein [Devosia sp.]|uniref:amidohydrolase family protein n=1 Tax=Devosia sp. TaxID=1871048 RepID=UPI0026233F96|nr:amidohydrolase family protein [Devosia sp.]